MNIELYLATMPPIPDDVVQAAVTLRRWADQFAKVGHFRQVRVLGIQCDTYVSVRDMLQDARCNEVFSEVHRGTS